MVTHPRGIPFDTTSGRLISEGRLSGAGRPCRVFLAENQTGHGAPLFGVTSAIPLC